MPPLDDQPVTLALAACSGAATVAYLMSDATGALALALVLGVTAGLSYTPDIEELTS
jgi:hypothetical protein